MPPYKRFPRCLCSHWRSTNVDRELLRDFFAQVAATDQSTTFTADARGRCRGHGGRGRGRGQCHDPGRGPTEICVAAAAVVTAARRLRPWRPRQWRGPAPRRKAREAGVAAPRQVFKFYLILYILYSIPYSIIYSILYIFVLL